MNTSIVLSVLSDDHPGIVESLSDVLASNGGNWAESSMLSLAGKFAGILLAQVPEGRVRGHVRLPARRERRAARKAASMRSSLRSKRLKRMASR